jgi:hypothetical protein
MHTEWDKILAGCSKVEARFILSLQLVLWALYSMPFFYLFTLGTTLLFNYFFIASQTHVELNYWGIITVHSILFFLYKNFFFARHAEEMEEIKQGIHYIINYLKSKS